MSTLYHARRQVLATELFNDEKTMVRLDMSEYVEPHTVYRLIGSPPGCKQPAADDSEAPVYPAPFSFSQLQLRQTAAATVSDERYLHIIATALVRQSAAVLTFGYHLPAQPHSSNLPSCTLPRD